MPKIIYSSDELLEKLAKEHQVNKEDIQIGENTSLYLAHGVRVDMWRELLLALQRGEKLHAIKWLREILGIGLKESKDIIDSVMK